MPRKGTTSQRGYGATHQRTRAWWTPRVARGTVTCARCGQPIQPGTPWDLGHTDDRRRYRGPEHQNCNRSAGARTRSQTTTQHDPEPTQHPAPTPLEADEW